MRKVLFEQGGVQLIAFDYLTDEFKAQINSTILGRKGKLRYQHTYGIDKAEKLQDTQFVQLHWKSQLVGVVAFSLQNLNFQGLSRSVLYIRYFSMSGLLAKRQGHHSTKQSANSGTLKKVIKNLFEDPSNLFPDHQDLLGIYAYVERDNLPSSRTVEAMGFQQVGNFTTRIYSRINPKKKLEIEIADSNQPLSNDYSSEQAYKDYHFVQSEDYLSKSGSGKWAKLRMNNEVIASVFYDSNQWKIKSIPGLTGCLSRNVLSKIPYLRNIFFDTSFDFITLEMVYLKEEHENKFPHMVESILAEEEKHHAILWVDPASSLSKKLDSSGKYGIIQKISRPTNAGIYFKSLNRNSLSSAPSYVSADGIS
ncbi:MAG: hypothetical protein ACO2ZZ_04295 [Cyclobacteriaceae bacterium]